MEKEREKFGGIGKGITTREFQSILAALRETFGQDFFRP